MYVLWRLTAAFGAMCGQFRNWPQARVGSTLVLLPPLIATSVLEFAGTATQSHRELATLSPLHLPAW